MGLWTDRAESDAERAVTLVEDTIRALGIDPAAARVTASKGGAQFALKRGSARVVIAIHPPVSAPLDWTDPAKLDAKGFTMREPFKLPADWKNITPQSISKALLKELGVV